MRREFPAKVLGLAFLRANGHCESCGAHLYVGKFHFDHRIPDAMGGKPTLDNCDVLCRACHSIKTRTKDVPAIAKVKRIRAAHIAGRHSRTPLPCGRKSKWKKKITGEVVLR